MFQKILLFFLILVFSSGCFSNNGTKLRISATTWIGYSPLFYAKAKGWLDPINIKLLNVVSLSENMYLYKAGNADAYVGTQYEYNILVNEDPTLKPVILFDRSHGGDVILGNKTLDEYIQTDEVINVYLEMDSINSTLLQDFLKFHKLRNKEIHYINQDQLHIASLKNDTLEKPTLIITYTPYNIQLRKNGFHELASTKDGLELFVADALFTNEKTFHIHKEKFVQLKKFIDQAITVLEEDPQEFYLTVKPYLLEVNFNEFQNSLGDIIWINKELSTELSMRLNEAGLPTRGLL
ncbi:MAG: hypothetical protein J7J31_02870 [Helicobacteraceae bacterium]|nr:hypothetical protein [Helicobacteraceae bacterium]